MLVCGRHLKRAKVNHYRNVAASGLAGLALFAPQSTPTREGFLELTK